MANKNIWDPDAPAEESFPEDGNKSNPDMLIVFYNLLVLAFYTVMCAMVKDTGVYVDAVFIVIHVFICLILTIIVRKSIWVLSGFLVLLIGFSTCAGILANLM